MYCRNCGRKLEAGAVKCRKCGEPADTAEVCGGFWGLLETGGVQTGGKEEFIRQEETLRRREETIRNLQKERNTQFNQVRRWKTISLAASLAACFLLAAFVTGVLLRKPPVPVLPEPDSEKTVAAERADDQGEALAEPAGEPSEEGAVEGISVAEDNGENAPGTETTVSGDADEETGTGASADPEAGQDLSVDDLSDEEPDGSDGMGDENTEPADPGFDTIVRGIEEDGYDYRGLEYVNSNRPKQVWRIVDERDPAGNGRIKYQDDEDNGVSCSDGYSRILYETREENGKSVRERKLLKGNDETADPYGTCVIHTESSPAEDGQKYTVIESFETEDGEANIIRKGWMPDYDRIRYTYIYHEMGSDGEFRLISEDYFCGEDPENENAEPVFTIAYDENSYDGGVVSGSVSFRRQDPEEPYFDSFKISYDYRGPEHLKDKYRVKELAFYRDGEPAEGPDGFARMECEYDVSGERTERYFTEDGSNAVIGKDVMLSWENTYLLHSEDFEHRYFPQKPDQDQMEQDLSGESEE